MGEAEEFVGQLRENPELLHSLLNEPMKLLGGFGIETILVAVKLVSPHHFPRVVDYFLDFINKDLN